MFLRKRLTYANVMSSLAVFLILGGATAFAAKKIGSSGLKANSVTTAKIKKEAVTTKKIKKNAVVGAKVKDGSLSGADINLSTLGTVPSATNATNVDTVRTFSVGASKGQLVSLVKTSTFELMGFCDPNDEAFPPGIEGTEAEREGTVYVIYNRSSAPAFAQSDDADNYKLELNQGIGFNYQDNGDGGMAMSTDGHFMALPSYANLLGDTSYENEPSPGDNYPFSTECHFAGAAFVG
jgi:hypothetical protein